MSIENINTLGPVELLDEHPAWSSGLIRALGRHGLEIVKIDPASHAFSTRRSSSPTTSGSASGIRARSSPAIRARSFGLPIGDLADYVMRVATRALRAARAA